MYLSVDLWVDASGVGLVDVFDVAPSLVFRHRIADVVDVEAERLGQVVETPASADGGIGLTTFVLRRTPGSGAHYGPFDRVDEAFCADPVRAGPTGDHRILSNRRPWPLAREHSTAKTSGYIRSTGNASSVSSVR